MFFFYSGTASIDVLPPGEQYANTIEPSNKSQKTTNERLYNYLFSDEFEHKSLFTRTTSFSDVPSKTSKPIEVQQSDDSRKSKKPGEEKGATE
jgi:hypothetical protein